MDDRRWRYRPSSIVKGLALEKRGSPLLICCQASVAALQHHRVHRTAEVGQRQIGPRQRPAQQGQQMGEVATRGRVGNVRPEQMAKLGARDGRELHGQPIEQRPRLPARDRQRRPSPDNLGRAEQAKKERSVGTIGRHTRLTGWANQIDKQRVPWSKEALPRGTW